MKSLLFNFFLPVYLAFGSPDADLPQTNLECQDLEVYNVTSDEVFLTWSRPCEDWTVRYYYLDINERILNGNNPVSLEVECLDDICSESIFGLKACMEYETNMNATERGGLGVAFYPIRNFSTLITTPNSLTDLRVSDIESSSMLLTWAHPNQHTECVAYYRVCYQIEGDTGTLICLQTDPIEDFSDDYSYLMSGLEPCGEYYITVQAVSLNGELTPAVAITQTTTVESPGEPTNLIVTGGEECVQLNWDKPTVNPYCVERYDTSCGEMTSFHNQNLDPFQTDYQELLCGLEACMEYNCSVVAISQPGGSDSNEVIGSATTSAEEEISAPHNILISSITTDSVLMSWTRPDQGYHCIDNYFLSWGNLNVTGQNDSYYAEKEDTSFEIENLLPCSLHEFHVAAVGEGLIGDDAVAIEKTSDVAPGAPVNCLISDLQCNCASVSFQDPIVNTQCAYDFEIDLTLIPTREADDAFIDNVQIEGPYLVTYCNLTVDTSHEVNIFFYSSEGFQGPRCTLYFRTPPFCG